jgi:membrane protein implicated in regulation of membrane protease activity
VTVTVLAVAVGVLLVVLAARAVRAQSEQLQKNLVLREADLAAHAAALEEAAARLSRVWQANSSTPASMEAPVTAPQRPFRSPVVASAAAVKAVDVIEVNIPLRVPVPGGWVPNTALGVTTSNQLGTASGRYVVAKGHEVVVVGRATGDQHVYDRAWPARRKPGRPASTHVEMRRILKSSHRAGLKSWPVSFDGDVDPFLATPRMPAAPRPKKYRYAGSGSKSAIAS